jgi:hypothetical protein
VINEGLRVYISSSRKNKHGYALVTSKTLKSVTDGDASAGLERKTSYLAEAITGDYDYP